MSDISGVHVLLLPCVNVCVLQSGKDSSLTATDKDVLQRYKQYDSKEPVIFVIDGEITDPQYCAVSKEIEGELELNEECNDILHRLFHCQTDSIGIRISMLFEKQLIDEICMKSPMTDLGSVKEQNKLDIQYHQLKCVSLRNRLICEFGYEKKKYGTEMGKLFVSIKKPEHENDVKHYLRKYLPNASSIEIIEFTEIEIANLALKSGDTIERNESYGTVGLCLTDGTRHFCATCKHVVDDGLSLDIETSNSNVIITNSEGEAFETDRILTPSANLDFSAIRLTRTAIPITYGLKNQFSRYVDGIVFGKDMMVPHKCHVYKWGATSKLTNGNFRRMRERGNLPAMVEIESYESTNFTLPGDSGSLICYSEAGFEFAAFILIGHVKNDDSLIVGYKLADAMNACETMLPNITACLSTENEELFSN